MRRTGAGVGTGTGCRVRRIGAAVGGGATGRRVRRTGAGVGGGGTGCGVGGGPTRGPGIEESQVTLLESKYEKICRPDSSLNPSDPLVKDASITKLKRFCGSGMCGALRLRYDEL